MARPIVPCEDRLTTSVHIYMRARDVADLDVRRGDKPRTEYIRAAIEAYAAQSATKAVQP